MYILDMIYKLFNLSFNFNNKCSWGLLPWVPFGLLSIFMNCLDFLVLLLNEESNSGEDKTFVNFLFLSLWTFFGRTIVGILITPLNLLLELLNWFFSLII